MAARAPQRLPPSSMPDRLQHLSSALARNERPLRQRLYDFLGETVKLFEDLELPTMLASVLGPNAAHWTLSQATGHTHLGFIAPPGCGPAQLAEVAIEHGFCEGHALFGSEIMARELAWRFGVESVPTLIFRADAPPRDGQVMGIEAFCPNVEASAVENWIAEGTGMHFAVGLRSPQAVEEALRRCQAQGLHPPPFFQGHPLLNVANAITVVYLDANLDGDTLRLEFYHKAGEPWSGP